MPLPELPARPVQRGVRPTIWWAALGEAGISCGGSTQARALVTDPTSHTCHGAQPEERRNAQSEDATSLLSAQKQKAPKRPFRPLPLSPHLLRGSVSGWTWVLSRKPSGQITQGIWAHSQPGCWT
ncbi:hypothetical protein P7K49_002208 [Saguinus oedipus]|uniref:Uncharacterized protein n=1 Tax=Saguinus oedipus TaxID=9490 RepID=A0ABQ9WGM9_SAGOE|nr:hypothetical protein P7K49_002208 [Saguinus oedipus]